VLSVLTAAVNRAEVSGFSAPTGFDRAAWGAAGWPSCFRTGWAPCQVADDVGTAADLNRATLDEHVQLSRLSQIVITPTTAETSP